MVEVPDLKKHDIRHLDIITASCRIATIKNMTYNRSTASNLQFSWKIYYQDVQYNTKTKEYNFVASTTQCLE